MWLILSDKNKSSGPDISMGEAPAPMGALRIDFAEIWARSKNLKEESRPRGTTEIAIFSKISGDEA